MAIFKDRTKLSPLYIPARMLHRDGEQAFMKTVLGGVVETIPNPSPIVIQLMGDVGSGKTTLSIKSGRWLEAEGVRLRLKIKHVYLNLRGFSGRVTVYRHLVRSVSEDIYSTSLAAEELLSNLFKHLKTTNTYLLLTFDEVDQYVSQSTGLIYDFTRLPELAGGSPTNILAVIFISRTGEFRRDLGRPELSSLGHHILRLEPYNVSQVYDILADRAAEAFQEGAISDEVIEYISEKAAEPPRNGDIRYGLDLLLYAGNLAEAAGRKYIGLDDVRKVVASLHSIITSDELARLDDGERLVLMAVGRALRVSGKAYIGLSEVGRMCRIILEEMGWGRSLNLRKIIQSLESKGILNVRRDGMIELRDIDLQSLEAYLGDGFAGARGSG